MLSLCVIVVAGFNPHLVVTIAALATGVAAAPR